MAFLIAVRDFSAGTTSLVPTGPRGPGYQPVGTIGAPVLVDASGLTAPSDQMSLCFIKGDGGPVTVTANPQIDAGAFVGQELVLAGTDDTDTVTFTDGDGLDLNGPIVIGGTGPGSRLWLVWDGTLWSEVSRR